jgi:hypothetical protein
MGTSTRYMKATYTTPAVHQASSAGRRCAGQRGKITATLASSSATQSPQIDSSKTCPKFDVVNTEYQEQVSAMAINGTSASDTPNPRRLSVARAFSRSNNAHCATKHSSASVATERPMSALDGHQACRQIRGTS